MSFGVGVVGLGMIAEFHGAAVSAMTGAHIAGCCSLRAEAAADFAARYGGKAFRDLDAMLADPSIHILAICTPSGAHLEPALAAFAAGKHVICEKPLETTTSRIDRMTAAAEAAGVMLAGIFPRRFNPATKLLRDAARAGRFGRIASADAYVKWWRPQAYYDSADWRGTWALDGGGALMNQSIHTIDLLLYVMGDVRHVRAKTRLIAHERIEVEDVATAMLEFESGAIGVIQGSTAAWSKGGHPAEVQIVGETGSVFLADDRFRCWEFAEETASDDDVRKHYGVEAERAGAGAADPKAIDFTWHQRNYEDAIGALNEGRAPMIDGREARRAVALIEAIYASARDGGEKTEVG